MIVRRDDEDVPGVLCAQDLDHGGEVGDSVDGLLINGDAAARNATLEQKVLNILSSAIVASETTNRDDRNRNRSRVMCIVKLDNARASRT